MVEVEPRHIDVKDGENNHEFIAIKIMGLNKFLVRAKINTYASAGEGGERKLDDGSRELVYEENGYKYRDRYFGSNPFAGEEIVWRDDEIIWAMNYYGGLTETNISVKEVYEFLKQAMRQVKENRPFRGPEKFDHEDFIYKDESNGTVDYFDGTETISYKGNKVYELKYHGGTMKK